MLLNFKKNPMYFVKKLVGFQSHVHYVKNILKLYFHFCLHLLLYLKISAKHKIILRIFFFY